MKCFVAMAFLRTDTDKMYENCILPALLTRNIQQVRVDKLEHNDNINDRIISEIISADFAIVDLTYARPSVYYEAGFAERSIPVIYTIRRDHLSPVIGDEFGQLKLHFDLSMKNIIDWTSPEDSAFVARLISRIDSVTAPLLADIEKKKQQNENTLNFLNLPLAKRKQLIIESTIGVLEKNNFLTLDKIEKQYGNDKYYIYGFIGDKVFFSSNDKILKIFCLKFSNEIGEIPYVYDIFDRPEFFNLNFNGRLGNVESIEEHHLMTAFHSVSFDSVCHKMPTFTPDTKHQMLTLKKTLKIPALPMNFTGEVFLDSERIYNDIIERWTGGTRYEGFRTRTPPTNSIFKRDVVHKDSYFVYKGFSFREVPRTIFTYLIDAIDSTEYYLEKLNKIFN